MVERVVSFDDVRPDINVHLDFELLPTKDSWDQLRLGLDTAGERSKLTTSTVIDPSDATLARVLGPAWPGHRVQKRRKK